MYFGIRNRNESQRVAERQLLGNRSEPTEDESLDGAHDVARRLRVKCHKIALKSKIRLLYDKKKRNSLESTRCLAKYERTLLEATGIPFKLKISV